jgi:hypothetical protein
MPVRRTFCHPSRAPTTALHAHVPFGLVASPGAARSGKADKCPPEETIHPRQVGEASPFHVSTTVVEGEGPFRKRSMREVPVYIGLGTLILIIILLIILL